MGFVIREISTIFVRSDNQQVLPTKRGKELFKQGLSVKKEGVIIIIYPEFDFEEFYKKHCRRIPNDNKDFTVLVKNETEIPEKEVIRKFVEEILKNKYYEIRENNSIVGKILWIDYKTKNFFSFNEMARDGFIRFRDITILKPKDLPGLYNKGIISKIEYEEIINKNYLIKEIWLIGHTDVV